MEMDTAELYVVATYNENIRARAGEEYPFNPRREDWDDVRNIQDVTVRADTLKGYRETIARLERSKKRYDWTLAKTLQTFVDSIEAS